MVAMAPRKQPMVVKPFRLTPELIEQIKRETEARPDWNESDTVREALSRGLASMAAERAKKPRKTR